MKNGKPKKMNRSKKQNKYRAVSIAMTSSLLIAPLAVPLTFYLPGGITASAAVLDAEILSNISSSNDSGTTAGSRWTADGSAQNVNFSISGGELVGASAIASGTKQAVLAIPNELRGNVATNGAATVNTNVTLTVGDLTFLTGTLDAVNDLTNLLTSILDGTLGSLTGVTLNLTEVNQKIDAINNLENLGSATFSANTVLASDGSYIQANLDDGLGLVLAQNVSGLLQDLKAAVDALQATGSGIASNVVATAINAALLPVKGTVDTAINLAIPLVNVGGSGVNQLIDATVLGSTSVSIPTTITSPTNLSQNLDARFVGTVVKADAIDVSLISTANGVSNVYYAPEAVSTVAQPVVTSTTGSSNTGYTVSGTATAGNTVEIRNTAGTTIGTGVANGSGDFTITIPQGQAAANESLNAVAIEGENESAPTSFTTPADSTTNVTAPTVDTVTGNSTSGYTVTGTATAGNTVEIRNVTGTTIGTGVANSSGDFTITIPQGQATANEALSAIAIDGENESTATQFTTPADSVSVAAPTVDEVTGNSTDGYNVTGTAPAGSTVEVKNAGGTTIGTATADENGDYIITIPAGAATPNEQLTATAKDADGNTSPGTNFTTPSDPVTVTAPTVDNVTGNSTDGYTVTGTAPVGSTVEIKNTGGTVIGTATADENGDFIITIPAGAATPNEQLTATAKDADGNTSPGTNFTTPSDPVTVTAPTVDEVTGNSADGYTVTGTATAGNTVEVRNTGGTVIGTATVDGNGDFTITIPAGAATPNEQLTATAKDADGNTSTGTNFITPSDPVTVTAPTVDEVTGNSADGYTVTGTAPAGSTVEIKNTGGTVIGTATADENGDFTITIPDGAATPNEQLTATAKDADGNTSPGTNFTTPADPVTVTAPTVDEVTGNSTDGYNVTGTAPAGSAVEIKNTGGTVIGTATADENGDFTITIPAGAATPNEQLTATAKDADGNTSPGTNFTTPSDPVTVTAPTVDEVTGNSADGYTVTGTAPAGTTVDVKNSGGTVVGTTTADENGNYTVTIPAGSATPNEQLTATAKDADGNTSPGTNFTTPSDPVTVTAPTVDEVTGNSADGYTVTGTAPSGSTVEIKNTGGTVIGTATADENGDYTITIPAGAATPNEQLTATAKDADGNTSPGTNFTTPSDPVTVTAPTVDEVTGNSADGYTVTGTATAGNTVEVRNTGGTIIGTATVDENGDYTITIPAGSATQNEQLAAIAKDNAGNSSSATPFVTPADPLTSEEVAAPIVDNVTGTSTDGYTVMGTATAGNTVEIRNANGSILGSALVNAEGNYSVMIPEGLATANEQLQAVAKDDADNTSSATLFVTPADPDVTVATPIIDKVEGTSLTGYTIYGKATPNNRVEIYNADQQLLGQARASAIQPVVNTQLYRSFAAFAPLAAEDGTFTITIPVGLAAANEQLQAIAKDDANNQSSVALFSTPADPGSGNGDGSGNGNGTDNTGNNGNTDNSGNNNTNGNGSGMTNNGAGTGTGNDTNGTANNGRTGAYQSLGGSQKDLPNNGETSNSWGILGAMVLGALGLFSFKRRNKE
ncbi:LPXTG cell wall anchor domain-containing protein [Erwinia sp. CPCC 100877]|nr:LPXTG cell wall anchor domain-containing protein [Erwinia sp. CPCC 100877]